MAAHGFTAEEAEAHVVQLMAGRQGNLLGSVTAAARFSSRHGSAFHDAWHDVDIFHPSEFSLATNLQFLLDRGAVPLNENEARRHERWERYDFGDWHTNSIRLELNSGIEVNLVYKTIDRHPLRTMHEQIGSFDFSHLSGGWNLKTGKYHDMHDFFWPDGDRDKIEMVPERKEQWLTGKIGQFTGVRQAGRYATNYLRGYDMELCKEPLVMGYRITAEHYFGKDDPELHGYAEIYRIIADLIEVDRVDELAAAYDVLQPHDPVGSLKSALP